MSKPSRGCARILILLFALCDIDRDSEIGLLLPTDFDGISVGTLDDCSPELALLRCTREEQACGPDDLSSEGSTRQAAE
jgi:hypothetical protein